MRRTVGTFYFYYYYISPCQNYYYCYSHNTQLSSFQWLEIASERSLMDKSDERENSLCYAAKLITRQYDESNGNRKVWR